MTSPFLWYLNRGTGVVLLVVFSLTVVIGVLATDRSMSPWWPRFVTQGLHRALAALSVLLLLAHAVSAVVDEYVDIRWWQAVLPAGATYQPVWLALGTVALDLTAVVIATSLARSRMPHRAWFLVHLATYLAWLTGVVHGLGIGTDTTTPWLAATTAGCVAGVLVAAAARLTAVARARARRRGPAVGGVGGVADLDAWDLVDAREEAP
ncbi:MAG TPA: ferric reductase-like transmembrane domain-containing protein [Phycicoccus sp.]|nr:ferric reductase-like transmembrane domain-containing protein [Phycicoccus sp.]